MGPADVDRAKTGPGGLLGDAIAETFGSFQSFRDQFTKAALTLFGSGFVYLVRDRKSGGQLAIKQYPNQDTPVMDGELPIVGLDVWEHAYVSTPDLVHMIFNAQLANSDVFCFFSGITRSTVTVEESTWMHGSL